MSAHDPVNILLVDDKPAKLLSYEAILSELGENLIKASSARQAFEQLLKREIAVVLTDVRMPEMDGFELAAMIREHPRFATTAIIFISASQPTDVDLLRSYKSGAVDYLPAPVIPELMRAKVKAFAELYRKTRRLEQLNAELEQRVAERTAALAESKRQLQFVTDHAPVLLAQCDADLRYKFVNRPYADFFGCRPPDIIGRHPREVLGELTYAHAAPYIEEVLAGHRTEYDLELSNTPRGPRVVRAAYEPEFDASGRVVGWVAAVLDITERKHAEAKVARLAAIVESSDDAIISKTLTGRITSWNAGAARIFGYTASEMIGQPITRIIPPELHEEEEQILARLKRGERIEHFETTRVAKDGHRIDISLSVSPVFDKAGKVIGASKVARDITERRRSERAQRKSEALASAVYAAALDAVITIDDRGMVVEWNPAAEQVFGYSRTDAIGREMAELIIPPRLREAHRRGLAHYLARREGPVLGRLIELPALRADGAEFPAELYIAPIPIEGPPLFTGFARDITDRKRAEERLHEALRLASVACEAARMGAWHLDVENNRLTYSGELLALIGIDQSQFGGTLEAAEAFTHPDDVERRRTDRANALAQGDWFEHDYRIIRPDGEVRWMHSRGKIERRTDGTAIEAYGMTLDITERKRAEEHVRFVMRELSHRTKNLMAVVQAIAWQTAQKSLDLADFEQRFTQRIDALARSHDLLVKREWQGVVLDDLVRAQLAPFLDRNKTRVAAHGPTLLLVPEAAQDLGLALHELATNALKYGALSVPTGNIDISWTIDDGGPADAQRFVMTWREIGGPPVSPPVRRGFGSAVITNTLSRSFKGNAKLDYAPEGISWELAAPLGHIITELP